MTVGDIERRMTARELHEWMAYYRLDPFGNERGDLQAGIIAATVANVNRAKGSRAFKPADFTPDFRNQRKRQTGEEMFQILRLFAQAHNARLSHG